MEDLDSKPIGKQCRINLVILLVRKCIVEMDYVLLNIKKINLFLSLTDFCIQLIIMGYKTSKDKKKLHCYFISFTL